MNQAPIRNIFLYNSDCEIEISYGNKIYEADPVIKLLMNEFSYLPIFLANENDIVLTDKKPQTGFIESLKKIGYNIPQFCSKEDLQKMNIDEGYDIIPWGFTPEILKFYWQAFEKKDKKPKWPPKDFHLSPLPFLYSKCSLTEIRSEFREAYPENCSFLGQSLADGEVFINIEDIIEEWKRISEELNLSTIIKTPYCSAGQGMLVIDQNLDLKDFPRKWIEDRLQEQGILLVEPRLNRTYDFSILIKVEKEEKDSTPNLISRFHTSNEGRYLGQVVGDIWKGIAKEDKEEILKTNKDGESLFSTMEKLGDHVKNWLISYGFEGYAGVDTFIYKQTDNNNTEKFYLKGISEINPRITMGHITSGIQKKVSPNSSGIWISLSQKQLTDLGYTTFRSLAKILQEKHPLQFDANNLVINGIYFSNDPNTIVGMLGIVGIGSSAIDYLIKAISKS